MPVPPTLTSGGLFAGVDGLGMAVDAVFGSEPLWFSEIDPEPSKVLAHRYPDVPNLGDITKIDFATVPRVDVLHGGFPCQDVSAAGARRGLRNGTRSGLWTVFARAIDEIRPRWVLIENVRGLLTADGEEPHDALLRAEAEVARLERLAATAEAFLNHNPAMRREGRTPHVARWRGVTVRVSRALKRAVRLRDRERRLVRRAIDTVLRDLADLGFDAEWFGLRAADVGAPHGRFRVFILAWPSAYTRDPADDGQRSRPGSTHGGGVVDADADGDGLGSIRLLARSLGDHADGRDGSGEATPEAEGGPADDRGHPVLTLLPTPAVVMNDGEGVETWLARRERVKAKGYNGNGMGMPLPIAVQLLPTPLTSDNRSGSPADERRHETQLRAIESLLPTPSVSNSHGNDRNSRGDLLLPGVAQLLPTPSAALGDGGQKSRSGERKGEPLLGGIAEMASAKLLPTPLTSDWNTPGGHGEGGDNLRTTVARLLPTPDAYSAERGGSQHPDKRRGGGHAVSLQDVAEHVTDWGPYQGAIDRWAHLLGRPAPTPTRPDGRDGNARLNPELTEWMMGWPAGHVTDPSIGISRSAQLKACGNGVVPQQAVIAILTMLARPGVPALITKEAA